MAKITGPCVAIVTPLNQDETINADALRRQVKRQVAAGNGVFCAGTNGEFYALSFDEKVRVAELCVEAAGGAVPVLAHIGEVSTSQTILLGRKIEKLDVKALSVITPSILACSQDELIAHYRDVADALTKPIYLYNLPARTGNTLQPETVRVLADHPNIVGIKDSAGSQESLDGYLEIARSHDAFDVLVGPDSLVLHGLTHGAAGCVSGLGNISPVTLNAIWASFSKGDSEAAGKHQAHYSELRKELYAHGFAPTMVKRCLTLAMPEVGASRRPAMVSAEVEERIRPISRKWAEATE